jgi:hypothetical protein
MFVSRSVFNARPRRSPSVTKTYPEITLKALANFSPGLLQPWEDDCNVTEDATLKELRRRTLTR